MASMKRAMILLAVVGLASLGLVACGGDGISEAELERQRDEAAQNARQEAEIKALHRELREQKQGGSVSSSTVPADTTESSAPPSVESGQIPGDARPCGSAYGAGSASCPFVENVVDDYYANGQRGSFTSYSPTTGLTYTVTCNGSSPTVCTAGRAAVIYIP